MSKNVSRTGMSRKRWEYLKALHPAEPRYLHVSARISFRANPLNPIMSPVPFVVRPGVTYNVGRNKAKRDRRVAA
jgi:hypothetical protein